MLAKSISYTNYNNEEKTKTYYFHLNKAEIAEMSLSIEGGLPAKLKAIVDAKNVPELTKVFKDLILKAYGEKSADGERFIKSPEATEAFEQSPAYPVLFLQLLQSEKEAADFIKGILPADMSQEVVVDNSSAK